MMILDDLVALPNTKERIAKSIEKNYKMGKRSKLNTIWNKKQMALV